MKKKPTLEEPPVDSLSLSFLDVLSCGLSAMLVLFFVFSVLPQGKEDMTGGAAQGNGSDRKMSQSGVRAKGIHATPYRSPFGVVVVMNGATTILEENDVEWEYPVGIQWTKTIAEQKPKSVGNSESSASDKKVRISGFTKNSPRNFKNVNLWISNNKLSCFTGADVELIGTVDVADPVAAEGESGPLNKAKLVFGESGSQIRGDKTLVLTVERMRKDSWIQSPFLQNPTNEPKTEPTPPADPTPNDAPLVAY